MYRLPIVKEKDFPDTTELSRKVVILIVLVVESDMQV